MLTSLLAYKFVVLPMSQLNEIVNYFRMKVYQFLTKIKVLVLYSKYIKRSGFKLKLWK